MVKYLFKTFVSDLQQKKQEMSKLAYRYRPKIAIDP